MTLANLGAAALGIGAFFVFWVAIRAWSICAMDRLEADAEHLRQRLYGNHFAAMVPVTHDSHDVIPVETGGEVVAHLCVTCDKQLPANYAPSPTKERLERVKAWREQAKREQAKREQAKRYDAPRRMCDGSGWDG